MKIFIPPKLEDRGPLFRVCNEPEGKTICGLTFRSYWKDNWWQHFEIEILSYHKWIRGEDGVSLMGYWVIGGTREIRILNFGIEWWWNKKYKKVIK